MILQAIIEGPILYATFLLFFACLLLRIIISGYVLFTKSFEGTKRLKFIFSLSMKACAPAHRLFIKKPIYTSIRYLFHIGLIVVPIWFAGHVMLWEESIFQFGYWSIGYGWSNRITLLVLFALLIFLLRRTLFSKARKISTIYDHLLLLITAFPYFTGYLLANNTIDGLTQRYGFYATGDVLWTLHILSGEIMILSIALLFVTTRVNPLQCMACTACVANCPTNTLISEDAATPPKRYLQYSHYQCICCGNCMRCCPEGAIALKHEISLRRLFQIVRKYTIHSETLCACEKCGSLFVPYAQYIKIQNTISANQILTCPSCRQRLIIDQIPH